MIAMEMGAPDPINDEEIAEEMRAAEELRVAEAMAAEPEHRKSVCTGHWQP